VTTTHPMAQAEARRTAKSWNAQHPDSPLVAVAAHYPPNCWSGTEKGWTVYLVPRGAHKPGGLDD
jgi:hypothetical protein